ncbi:urea ABC transporter permease [Lampropedia cohaerens]|uniref:Urea ABC transporter permease n=1 Tax=Lampropedia cohaerens TaxID=1610491 RepID=A0A0U1PY72_9BURK|nr:urea ABC transporter permease [Lampropedia cohaerens]
MLHRWAAVLALSVLAWLPQQSHAALEAGLLQQLATGSISARADAIASMGLLDDPMAETVLRAMQDGLLRATPDGQLWIEQPDGSATNVANGAITAMPGDARRITINNRLRRALALALATKQLHAQDSQQRLAAAQQLRNSDDTQLLPAIQAALQRESNARVRDALEVAKANLELQSSDSATRLQAVQTLGRLKDASFRSALEALTRQEGGQWREPDAEVRAAAAQAVAAIDAHVRTVQWVGNAFYGLSLGSVLLLAALGLAIIFGLMGVINMAHGEFLMIGAYATYVVQMAFRQWAPGWLDWYVIAALPVAFVATACVGMVLERTVIRWLYGRPLETLLATWGISLILMQAVRSLFGAQNVEVANPGWLSGGVEVMNGLVLSYNRLAVIAFSLLVVLFVWLLLNHTRLGLFVRAITQNRRMADCVGVPTGRVDMLTFGLGAGIAGLGGVALSQLGNVGPDLGRAYIIDSFMVVVLGGVGQLAGTVIAAFGLGAIGKFIEPFSGAVLAKIAILVLIVLFIQKRPQGLFAPKGRSVE